ncbi:MAG: hypothetical protein AB1697_02000, partial [Pseudomonadota bacterium]
MTTVSYLARQPIVDQNHRLVAYELLFRQTESCRSAKVENPLQAGVEIISNTLCLGTDWLLQGGKAFINLPHLKIEWVMGNPRSWVKGGRSPAERTLDARSREIRWPVAGC